MRARKQIPPPTSFVCQNCGVTMIVETDGPFGREIIHEGRKLFVYGRSRPVHPPIPCIRVLPDDAPPTHRFDRLLGEKPCIECGRMFSYGSKDGARRLCRRPECKAKRDRRRNKTDKRNAAESKKQDLPTFRRYA